MKSVKGLTFALLAVSLHMSCGPLNAQASSSQPSSGAGDGFMYDWEDPVFEGKALREQQRDENMLGEISAAEVARQEERRQLLEEQDRAVAEYNAAQRRLAQAQRKRSEDLFKGPDIGAAMLRGFGQGLSRGLGRVQREQQARNRAREQAEYEKLKSQVAAAKYRAEQATGSTASARARQASRERDREREAARRARLDEQMKRSSERRWARIGGLDTADSDSQKSSSSNSPVRASNNCGVTSYTLAEEQAEKNRLGAIRQRQHENSAPSDYKARAQADRDWEGGMSSWRNAKLKACGIDTNRQVGSTRE